jgi:DNA topoisomerase-3
LPPLAYDLTELQRDANRKYGFSAKATSSVMQQLYEYHKIVTYPRTDSRYISEDIVPTLSERLKSIAIGPYAEFARRIMKTKIAPTKRFVDNTKVSDHHAIIPTEQPVNLQKLSSDEYKIYDLIVKRFLAVLSKAFEYEQTTVNVGIQGELFVVKGKIVKQNGWKEVYKGAADIEADEDEDEQEQTLPDLHKEDIIPIIDLKTKAGKTKPPARYTEATLLSAMEHPVKILRMLS